VNVCCGCDENEQRIECDMDYTTWNKYSNAYNPRNTLAYTQAVTFNQIQTYQLCRYLKLKSNIFVRFLFD
jgi:hypothetical protein